MELKLPKRFRLAKLISKQSEYKIQLGAVIYKSSKPISFGFNYLKTHPIFAKEFGSIHAEISAILKAQTDLTGASIYVYREFKDGSLANAKPCSDCMKAIITSGITRIYYTTNNGYEEIKL